MTSSGQTNESDVQCEKEREVEIEIEIEKSIMGEREKQ